MKISSDQASEVSKVSRVSRKTAGSVQTESDIEAELEKATKAVNAAMEKPPNAFMKRFMTAGFRAKIGKFSLFTFL